MNRNRLVLSLWLFLAGSVFASSASAWNWQTDACRTATAGSTQWQNAPLIPMQAAYTTQPQHLSISFSAIPNTQFSDTLFGPSQGAQSDWRGVAAIVRFNQAGMVDVRDGDTYRADMPYSYRENTGYLIRMEIDLAAHTYSVYISPDTNWTSYRYEQLLAKDYRFRTEQQSVTTLDNLVVEAEVGALHVCQNQNYPYLAATAGNEQWQNAATPFEFRGSPSASWFVTPTTANSDALLGLSNGPQTTWTGLAAIVRFNSNGTIDVRNGDRYMADTVVAYEPNKKYRVDIWFSIRDGSYPSRRYSVSITPEGGSTQTIATWYQFRTEQQNVSSLNNWTAEAEIGGLKAVLVQADLN